LFLIILNYFAGIYIANYYGESIKKKILFISIILNLSVLLYFKYLAFIIQNIFFLFNIVYAENTFLTNIILPLGLSFYTFQNIGYLLDIYRGSLVPEKNVFTYALFILFFPKLLVGPIERGKHFLTQLNTSVFFHNNNLIEGGKRIVWGLFKKLVVAERIALYVSVIDAQPEKQSGLTIFVASLLYTIQVYADFSGYADMAIGSAKLFGYNLMENFNKPLFAKNLSDFWRRWHISLSSWVNDYIFNPILLSKRNWKNYGVLFALLISFMIIGIWHGASWNYLIFGILQAIVLYIELLSKKFRSKIAKSFHPGLYNILSIAFTFLFISFCLIIFRSPSLNKSSEIFYSMFKNLGGLYIDRPSTFIFIFLGILLMMLYDLKKSFNYPFFNLVYKYNWIVQNVTYAFLIIYILIAGVFDAGQFIYFSF
jgi:D-alanyl-lipoteichoic acid acyltransferase DltB (MBOAT superfamily)